MSEHDTRIRQNGIFYGWLMVAVAFLCLAVSSGGITYSYSVVTVILNREFHASQFELMLPMTMMTLAGAFIAPFVGPKLDKFPVKRFMAAGVLSLALGLFLVSLAPAIGVVAAIYGLLMAPVNALLGPLCCSVLVSRWFEKRLSLAMGITSVGVSVGGFLMPPLIEQLCSHLGWRDAFQLISLAVLIVLLPPVMFVVDRPSLKGLHPDGLPPGPKTSKPVPGAVFNRTSTILRNRNFWRIGLAVGLLFGSYTAMIGNLLPIVMRTGLSSHQGAILVSTISGVGIAGKLMFGWIADRMDLRLGLGITVLLVISGMAIYMLGTSFEHFLLGSVVLGLAVGNMLPAWGALIAAAFGVTNYGRVMGLMGPINVTCNFLFLPLTGFLYDRTGSYTAPLSIFIALLALSLFWVPAIQYDRGSRVEA